MREEGRGVNEKCPWRQFDDDLGLPRVQSMSMPWSQRGGLNLERVLSVVRRCQESTTSMPTLIVSIHTTGSSRIVFPVNVRLAVYPLPILEGAVQAKHLIATKPRLDLGLPIEKFPCHRKHGLKRHSGGGAEGVS